MNITFIEAATNDDFIYLVVETNTLRVLGRIGNYRNYYLFNDYVFNDWWTDTELKGMKEEIVKYYNE